MARRIGCFALVDRRAGSCVAAHYLLIEELLRRDNHIDFYGIRGYVEPRDLFGFPNFKYLGYRVPSQRLYDRWLPPRAQRLLHPLVATPFWAAHMREIGRDLRRAHAQNPYDLVLILGLSPPFKPPAAPTIAWAQAAPGLELQGIRNSREIILRYSGAGTYAALSAYYQFRDLQRIRELRRATLCVLGSPFSASALTQRWPDVPARSLAYAIDLERFAPGPRPPPQANTRFLWLGRITPRKRLDLMVDGFLRFLEREPRASLKVVGSAPYAGGLLRLLDRLPSDRFQYLPRVDRNAVPDLLRTSDVLVQPSEQEDFGSSVAEALACGTTAVIGPTNGTRAYVNDATFSFDDYTPEAVADAMERAARALRADREQVQLRARRAAEREFSLPVMVDRLEAYALEAQRAHGRAGQPAYGV